MLLRINSRKKKKAIDTVDQVRLLCFVFCVYVQLTSIRDSFSNKVWHDTETHSLQSAAIFSAPLPLPPRPPPPLLTLPPVDCSMVKPMKPVHMGLMTVKSDHDRISFAQPQHYYTRKQQRFPISLSWWDKRHNRKQKPIHADVHIQLLYNLLQDTPGALVDVGTNVGFLTNLALAMHRRVYAMEPSSYHIAKVCEAYRSQHFTTQGQLELLELYHAAAAGDDYNQNNSTTTIVTHSNLEGEEIEDEGDDDNTVGAIVDERVPMVTVDSILYSSDNESAEAREPIALVKLDVQGGEYDVLVGMKRLLSQATIVGYPKYIFCETDHYVGHHTKQAHQRTLDQLEEYGYRCQVATIGNALCTLGDSSKEAHQEQLQQQVS